MFFRKKKKPPDTRLVLTLKGQFVLFALKRGMTYEQAQEEWKHIDSKEPFDPRGNLREVFEDASKKSAAENQQDVPPV